MNTLGQNLVAYRKRAGLNQKDLAYALGISPTRLNYWEKDKAKPTIEFIEKIAEALNVFPSDLMGWGYFDKKYPNIVKENKDFVIFNTYLESLGYICSYDIDEVLETETVENVVNNVVINRQEIPRECTYKVKVSNGKTIAKFKQKEFEALRKQLQDLLDGLILLQSQKTQNNKQGD